MTLFNRDLRSNLLGIAAMTLLQLLVLFAIGAAVVRYLEWSSDAAQAEFTSAIEAASDPIHSSEFSTPNQTAKGERVAIGRLSQRGAHRADLRPTDK
jgi:hypothetical protein